MENVGIMASKIRTRKLQKFDGLQNVLSGKGSLRSKSGSSVYTKSKLLSSETIRNIYESGGIGAKVITRVADDITRKGFRINSPNGEQILEEFDRLGGTNKFNEAIRWARAFGGSLIVITADDGGELEDPLDMENIKNIESLDVYEAGNSDVVQISKYYDNIYESSYGKPEIYQINASDGSRFSIHESRCIRIDGRVSDTTSKAAASGWNGSELQPVYDALLAMFSQMMSGEQVLDEMVIGVLKLEDIDSMCMDEEGESILRKRLDLVDRSKSNENSIVIGINEEYDRQTTNLSGMSNIQHNAMILVAGAADIPATFLYGSSPDGQNATGASDKEQYYGKIDAERQYLYKPALVKLLSLLSRSSETIKITFPSMQVSTLYDTAKAMDHVSKSITNMVVAGIYSVAEGKKMFDGTYLIDKISVLE